MVLFRTVRNDPAVMWTAAPHAVVVFPVKTMRSRVTTPPASRPLATPPVTVMPDRVVVGATEANGRNPGAAAGRRTVSRSAPGPVIVRPPPAVVNTGRADWRVIV